MINLGVVERFLLKYMFVECHRLLSYRPRGLVRTYCNKFKFRVRILITFKLSTNLNVSYHTELLFVDT